MFGRSMFRRLLYMINYVCHLAYNRLQIVTYNMYEISSNVEPVRVKRFTFVSFVGYENGLIGNLSKPN